MSNRAHPWSAPRRPAAAMAGLLLWASLLGTLTAAEPGAAQTSRRDTGVYAHTLEHRPASAALSKIRPLLSPSGTVEEQPGGNTLVIRDTAGAIARIVPVLEAFDRPPQELRFDIQIVRAGPRRAISPPLPPSEDELPSELLEQLRQLLRYEDYRVLAQAAMTSSEGEEVTYSLGQRYSVAFRLAAVSDGPPGNERLRLENFRIIENDDRSTNKSRQLEPRQLFQATLNLWIDRPFNLVLPQKDGKHEALMVAITCRRDGAPEAEGDEP